MQGQALPGFRDFYPEELALRNHIFTTWRDVARRYGFQEYDGPPLEPLELYTDKSGDEIVQQLYAFQDKGERQVALRPEMTPTLARMVGARAQALKKPIRWFSMPQLFRYERQQRGRLREHFQLNMDVIGEAGPAADAEVMGAVIDIARGFGPTAGGVRLRVSDRRILVHELHERHAVADGEMLGVLSALDKWGDEPALTERRLHQALGNSPERKASVAAFLGLLAKEDPATVERLLAAPAAEPLRECRTRLDAMGLGDFVTIDFRIVRGLAYYTGLVFELFDAKRSLRAIWEGGRGAESTRRLFGCGGRRGRGPGAQARPRAARSRRRRRVRAAGRPPSHPQAARARRGAGRPARRDRRTRRAQGQGGGGTGSQEREAAQGGVDESP